jgi:FkbM family methyltransferase
MSMIISYHAKRLFWYICRFGPIFGPYLFLKIISAKDCIPLRLPAYSAPVFLRAHTSDIPVFEKIFIFREYDLSFLTLQPKFIIDGGANVGYSTLFFAHEYPNARIVAVEPESSNFDLLTRNVEAYPNVTTLKGALWNRKALLKLENPQDAKWAFRVKKADSPDSDTTQAITIMDLLEKSDSEYIDILKLDIEGAEKELFQSNYQSWLCKTGIIVAELHDWFRAGCSTSFYRALRQCKFKQFQKGENVIIVTNKTA